MPTKDFVIHIRFTEIMYEMILREALRLGMSQTDTVRYIVTRYFEINKPLTEAS